MIQVGISTPFKKKRNKGTLHYNKNREETRTLFKIKHERVHGIICRVKSNYNK